jgi:predicted nucleotidyltransferase
VEVGAVVEGSVASAAVEPAVVAREEVGKRAKNRMANTADLPEKEIEEFVTRLRQAAGTNLESVILYGSAASGEYDAEYSDINLLCVLKDTAFAKLGALAGAMDWWTKRKYPLPIVITMEELRRSADVFVIELIDMQKQHRVLFGQDGIGSLEIPIHRHRAQLEYELREKLILLRQKMIVAAGNPRRMWDLLLESLPAFTTLFRHALMVQGRQEPSTKRETIKVVASTLGYDASPFESVLDVREHRVDRKSLNVEHVAAQYLAAAEQVTAAIDRMLDSPESQGPALENSEGGTTWPKD